jgi:hypothetical protein
MFVPENDLERSLALATADPARRPAFYRDFAQATVYFVPHGPAPSATGPFTLVRGACLRIAPVKVEGRAYLPLFTSVTRLTAALRDADGCVGITALEFLKVTRGAEVILNPGSGCAKIFTADEIAGILDGAAADGG